MPPVIEPAAARAFAIEVVRQLREAGFEALWAGGCVRDQLLGKTPKDFDVATSARPDEVRGVFGRRRTIAIGAAFGVISVLGPREAGPVDVATFRRDAGYSDGRHPDSVIFSTAEDDAQRRDFTINGLFFDPLAEQVIDYVGGVADLKRQIVRAIRDPHERFDEDKLRMLRAVRFATTFGFELEAETLAAIAEHAGEIVMVSAERIAGELRRMFAHSSRADALRLLSRSGLLPVIWPEAEALASAKDRDESDLPSAWERALTVLDALVEPCFSLVIAAVLREAAPPGERAEAAAMLFRRWRLSNAEREITQWVLAHEADIRRAPELPWSRVQRILISEHVAPLIEFAQAVAGVEDGQVASVEFCRSKLALPREMLDPPTLVGGHDLKRAGIRPGPTYKELLDRVRDAQLDGIVNTKLQALDWIRAQVRASG